MGQMCFYTGIVLLAAGVILMFVDGVTYKKRQKRMQDKIEGEFS